LGSGRVRDRVIVRVRVTVRAIIKIRIRVMVWYGCTMGKG